MPIALSPQTRPRNGLTKFTNCRLLKGDRLVREDLWVSSISGSIIHSQATFYDDLNLPDETIDLGGRIVAPGMIECQLNGAFGFNFSTLLDDMTQYGKNVKELNRLLIQTGVTSYTPTITSQRPELYQKVRRAISPSPAWLTLFRHCRTSVLRERSASPMTEPSPSAPTVKALF